MEISDQELMLLLANCAVLLGSIVQASTGMGFAMIAAPLLAIINLELVPGPMLLVNLCLTIMMLGEARSNIIRKEVAILLPAIAFGTVIAVTILSSVSAHLFSVLFAVLILLAVAISLIVKIPQLSSLSLSIGGVMAGLMGTAAGISGPPMAVLYQREEINKTRATLSLVFSFSYIASLVALTYAGKFDWDLALKGLLMLPGLLVGFLVARYVRGWLSQAVARILMLSIATLSAVLLLLKTIL